MKRKTFEKYFSDPRLIAFLRTSDKDWTKAIALYRSNLRLSQAFYPLLSLVEVTLRNAVDIELKSYFSDPNWISKQQNGFMNDPSLRSLNPPFLMRRSVRRAIAKIGKSPFHGKLISELNFGFWTTFFEKRHYKLLKGRPIKIFLHKPSNVSRKEIYALLNSIRIFRNRIYHYEPICFKKSKLDLALAREVHKKIYKFFNWINSDLAEWAEFVDFVDYELERFNNHSENTKIVFHIIAAKLKLKYVFRKLRHIFKIEKYK